MSAQERIQKLEALLSRINTRAAEPRAARGGVAASAAHAPIMHPTPAHVAAVTPAAIGSAPKIMEPPPMRPPAASAPEIETGEEYIDDVEVSTEVVEVDVDDEGMGEEPATAYMSEPAVPEIPDVAPADEEAPASSKRPIAMQAAEQEEAAPDAYADNPPRHTPPPESGKQVATPSPSPPPASVRRPSAPPAREEEESVGNWREPGLAEQPKRASIPPPAPPPPVMPPPPPRPAAPAPSNLSLSQGPMPPAAQAGGPQVMRPQIAPSNEVAKIEGTIAAQEASSFGDLLDTTLDL